MAAGFQTPVTIALLHRLGSVPAVQQAGFQSPVTLGLLRNFGSPPATTGGGLRHYPSKRRYVDLSKRERGFSRKYWEELQAAWKAQEELELRAEQEKREKQKTALAKAARQAEQALLAAESAESEIANELARVTRTLNAALGAKSLVEMLRRSQAVMAASKAAQEALDEEEEIAMVLLLS